MMGGHHAACGAAAWVAVASTAPFALGLHEVSAIGVITGTLVCAGAALLPDIDHPDGTIANSLPPLTEWIAQGVNKASGGHRHGTHSIIGAVVFTLMAWVAGLIDIHSTAVGTIALGAGVLTVFLAAFALTALRLVRGKAAPWLVSVALAVFIAFAAPQEWNWLPVAVGLGCIVHIVGDMLTTGGVPLLWPVRAKSPRWVRRTVIVRDIWRPAGNCAIPLLGNAGSLREWLVCIPITMYAICGVVWATLELTGILP